MKDRQKLTRLKKIRRDNLEKNLLEVQLKGYDHYIFFNERGKAQVITEQGRWVVEHIRTAVLKFNYQVDEINNGLMADIEKELKNSNSPFISTKLSTW